MNGPIKPRCPYADLRGKPKKLVDFLIDWFLRSARSDPSFYAIGESIDVEAAGVDRDAVILLLNEGLLRIAADHDGENWWWQTWTEDGYRDVGLPWVPPSQDGAPAPSLS